MIRGTSQQFKFKLPYEFSKLTEVNIAFWQDNNQGTEDYALPIIKHLGDCTPNALGTVMYVTLNSKETLAFDTDKKAYVQLWATTVDGFPFGSREKPFTVYPINEVLLPTSEDVVNDE